MSTLRQAVRMLEQHSVVRMERGRAGGLVVAVPEPAAAMGRALDYLGRTEVDPQDAASLRRQLGLKALSAIAEMPTEHRALALAGDGPGLSLTRFGALSGDAAIEIFSAVVDAIAPVAYHDRHGLGPLIAGALVAGDAARARRLFLSREQRVSRRRP